jgi:hypothetical protein
MKYIDEIFPTIYEQVPKHIKEEFLICSPALIRITAKEEEWRMPETDKWYINYN